jgi:hypothetical protein
MDQIIDQIIWKENWENKINDETIVNKWREEVAKSKNIDIKYFETAIFMLKSMTRRKIDYNHTIKTKLNELLDDENIIKLWKEKLDIGNIRNIDELINKMKSIEYKKYKQFEQKSKTKLETNTNLYDYIKIIDNLIPQELKEQFKMQLKELEDQVITHPS